MISVVTSVSNSRIDSGIIQDWIQREFRFGLRNKSRDRFRDELGHGFKDELRDEFKD